MAAFSIGRKAETGVCNHYPFFADAGDDIRQRLSLRHMVMHVTLKQPRNGAPSRLLSIRRKPAGHPACFVAITDKVSTDKRAAADFLGHR